MKFGCCADIAYAHVLHDAGYDFIECTVVSLIPDKPDHELAEVLQKFKDSPLPIEACNVFLPGYMKIVGEHTNENQIKSYLEQALQRVHQIGAEVVVFGSGAARTIPDGFSQERGEEQILQFLNLAADFAEPLGITIVIEPLNKQESNVINTVKEAQIYAEKINRPSIQVLADFYHMDEEDEQLENIISAKNFLKHVHVADTGRMAPGTGAYPYNQFVQNLQKAGYDQRVSIECRWNDFENEIVRAREFLHQQFTRSGGSE